MLFDNRDLDDLCPFCRSNDLEAADQFIPGMTVRVSCNICFADGPPSCAEELADLYWQRRVTAAGDTDACPFCGTAEHEALLDEGLDEYRVVCRECEAQGPDAPTEKIARERWQRRGMLH